MRSNATRKDHDESHSDSLKLVDSFLTPAKPKKTKARMIRPVLGTEIWTAMRTVRRTVRRAVIRLSVNRVVAAKNSAVVRTVAVFRKVVVRR